MSTETINDAFNGAPSVDDLATMAIDQTSDEQTAKALLVANGKWITDPSKVRISTFVDPDDKRPSVRVRAGLVSKDGQATDEISFKFSPVLKLNGKGKPDGQSQKYLQIKSIVKKATGTEPQFVGELASYLTQYPVELEVGQFNPGDGLMNVVYRIKAAE